MVHIFHLTQFQQKEYKDARLHIHKYLSNITPEFLILEKFSKWDQSPAILMNYKK